MAFPARPHATSVGPREAGRRLARVIRSVSRAMGAMLDRGGSQSRLIAGETGRAAARDAGSSVQSAPPDAPRPCPFSPYVSTMAVGWAQDGAVQDQRQPAEVALPSDLRRASARRSCGFPDARSRSASIRDPSGASFVSGAQSARRTCPACCPGFLRTCTASHARRRPLRTTRDGRKTRVQRSQP